MRAAATSLLLAGLVAGHPAHAGPAIPPDPSASTPPAVTFDLRPSPRAGRADHLAAVRAEVPPVIDGVLSEPEWRAATAPPPFVQRRPSPGQAPGDATELRVL